MIKAEIVADSINPCGNRLTTFVLEYPRFVHAELMTHRMFSKNSASSRAIPTEKFIEMVEQNPAMPIWWGKNQSGMQAQEELDNSKQKERYFEFLDGFEDRETKFYQSSPCGCTEMRGWALTDLEYAKVLWLQARDAAVSMVKEFRLLGLHKQIANRILEPWFDIRIILSATEFENFFALRVHEAAQPEIRELARQMLECMNASEPRKLNKGEWHIPFGDKIDEDELALIWERQTGVHGGSIELEQLDELKRKIAVARCARVSYFNFDGKDDYEADIKLCDRLFGSIPRHLSPTEHVAQALDEPKFVGNFCGWLQMRKMFQDENLKDERLKKE